MRTVALTLLLLLSACTVAREGIIRSGERAEPEAVSLLGRRLYPRPIPDETRARLEAELAEVEARYQANPSDVETLLWYGRRLAYLERYRDALEVFGEGIRRFPDDPRVYRHRGHRLITVRRFDDAVVDLEHAADLIQGRPDEPEPDGAATPHGVPVSTLHSNIWYHLGLAYYLKGEWENAAHAYEAGLEVSLNDDMQVAMRDWLYMTLRRLGRETEALRVLAPIHRGMQVEENGSYLRRLLMYKGELPVDALHLEEGADELTLATQGYGLGNWYLYNGDPERAREIFEQVVAGGYWAAFGHIAAEVELARMRR